MSLTLLWLAVPLLLLPVLARPGHLGGAVGQLIIAGLGVAALHQGAGTLDPRDLHEMARQSASDAWFVRITAGALISGACLFPDVRNWRKLIAALPLGAGLLIASWPAGVPFAVGVVIGCVPSLMGRGTRVERSRRRGVEGDRDASVARSRPSTSRPATSVLLGGLTVISAVIGPIAMTVILLCTLAWREWWREFSPAAGESGLTVRMAGLPVLPIAATIFLVVWTWLALTIAGSPWIGLRAFAAEAPVSAAGGRWLALLAIGWGTAIAAPWPFDRRTGLAVQLPVVAIVLYLAAACGTPDGMSHWQPMFSIAMILVAIAAAASQRWHGAAAALVLLAAARGSTSSLAAALLAAMIPAGSRLHGMTALRSVVVGVAAAWVASSVLRDQVALALVLAFGLAAVANRHDRVVAPG